MPINWRGRIEEWLLYSLISPTGEPTIQNGRQFFEAVDRRVRHNQAAEHLRHGRGDAEHGLHPYGLCASNIGNRIIAHENSLLGRNTQPFQRQLEDTGMRL